MKLLRGPQPASRPGSLTVVTVGNFDGVHLGHQHLMASLIDYAKREALDTAVILFEPQPKEFFLGSDAPPRLSSLRDKVVAIRNLGIDWIWVQRFDDRLATQAPETFARDSLVGTLRARHVVVGDDFRFGLKRRGDLSLLQQIGNDLGFTAEGTGSFLEADQRVSSTAVREALLRDDFATAERLLGRPYSLSGKVIHGQHLGRELGFPTANIAIGHRPRPVNGVYRVRVYGRDNGVAMNAIANVGIKPSFAHLGPLLEVHLLDRTLDLYGQPLTVEFIEKVRAAHKFNSLEELQAQIQKDITTVRAAFARPEE